MTGIGTFSPLLRAVALKPAVLGNMLKINTFNREGSEVQYGPRMAGEILHGIPESGNEQLAIARRERILKDLFSNTEIGIDMKLITREPGRVSVGTCLDGAITRDGEYHYTFIQNDSDKRRATIGQRNPHVYEGKRINVNQKPDGTLYPTFNRPRYTEGFTFLDFCREAADELYAFVSLMGKNPAT